jgi:hypothetical protein
MGGLHGEGCSRTVEGAHAGFVCVDTHGISIWLGLAERLSRPPVPSNENFSEQ